MNGSVPDSFKRPAKALTHEEAAAEGAWLSAEIARHDERYHGEDAPIISDAEYDQLRRRLNSLRAAHPKALLKK